MNHKTAIIAGGAAIVSAAAGAIGGYYFGIKKATDGFQDELKAQLAAADQVFQMKHKVGMYSSPITVVERRVPGATVNPEQLEKEAKAAHELYQDQSGASDDQLQDILTSLRRDETGGRPGHPISGPPTNGHRKIEPETASVLGLREDLAEATEDVNRNLFDKPQEPTYPELEDPDQPNYLEFIEANPRTKDKPYVITATEFFTEGNDTTTLGWFDEDGILADERDQPIEDADMIVGEENMERFGQWSGSSTTVYIRNEKLRTDFEVVRTRGSYAEAVGLKEAPRTKRKAARRGADE